MSWGQCHAGRECSAHGSAGHERKQPAGFYCSVVQCTATAHGAQASPSPRRRFSPFSLSQSCGSTETDFRGGHGLGQPAPAWRRAACRVREVGRA